MSLLTWLRLRRSSPWDRPTLLESVLSSPLSTLATLFYHLVLLLRGRPLHPPRGKTPIRVVCIADTHGQTVDIPPGDVLIHAGDLSSDGSAAAIQSQVDWLKRQPHQVKVLVAGNHDSWFDPASRSIEDVKAKVTVDLTGVSYLEDSAVVPEIRDRRLFIYGAPHIPNIGPADFAFQYTEDCQPWFSKVHPDTEILVTHTPPKFHLDLSIGCPHLLREVWRVRPRLHVFGHVHWGHGKESVYFDDLQQAYERFMSRPHHGLIRDFAPGPAWLDLLAMAYHGVHSVLWKWLMGGPGSNQASLMVNAAQMYGNTGKMTNQAIVVDM